MLVLQPGFSGLARSGASAAAVRNQQNVFLCVCYYCAFVFSLWYVNAVWAASSLAKAKRPLQTASQTANVSANPASSSWQRAGDSFESDIGPRRRASALSPPFFQTERCGTVTGPWALLRSAKNELTKAGKSCAANGGLVEPLCVPLAGSAHSSHQRCAPLGVGAPKSASVGGVPECECSGRCQSRAVVRVVTSYLRRKRSYCWPCLLHDGAWMMVLLISYSTTLGSCLPLLRRPF